MNSLTLIKSNVVLGIKRICVLLAFMTISVLANAGGTSYTYTYKVTVQQGTAPIGSGTVYLSATATVYDSNQSQWGDPQSPSSSVELDGSKELSISCIQDREDNDPKKNPYIQFTNVKLKAVPMAGSKFVRWSWVGGESSDATISISDSEKKQCPNDEDDQSATYTNNTIYTAHFIPRTYYYKMPGADANEGGKVYISTTAGRPAEDSGDWQTKIAAGTTTSSQTADDNGRYAKATIKIYCYAQSPGDDYEFVGWFAATGGVLSTDLDYEYDFVSASENSSKPATNTLHAVFRPKNTITTITAENVASIELYTGTEIFVEGNATYGKSPYCKKTRLDLRATFAPDGTPLFNTLYIFGMTISPTSLTVSGQTGHKITAASTSVGSDAITPCYVYVKNGNQYDLQQTILNMNVTNKPIADISGATSVYLTGYCPYASTGGGNNKDENGVFCFTGGAGVKLDVYVDDLQLYARYKSSTGKTTKPDTVLYSNISTTYRCAGTSSALTFKGTSSNSGNPFQPTIHMRDSNRLAGNVGSAVRVKVEALGMSMDQTAGQYNSPIGLLTDEDKRYTTLSIDDVWPASMADNATANVRTNGFLDIRTTTAAPCIDLYDQYGKVNFNGGRIYLKNSRPSGSNNYLCTFAIGYRTYEKSVSVITAKMYGLGTDQSGGEVNFNDGSFYIDPLTDAEFTTHGKYYHHKYALKCPASSTINGGTYYCEPFSCTESENLGASPLNKYGDGLVLDTVAVESLLEPYKTAVINFPNDKEVQEEYAATYPATLGDYYTAKGATYGISSLNAYQGTHAPDSVILMLPVQYTDKALQKEVANIAWALCIPKVVAGGEAASVSIGGDIEVADREEENAIYQTNYLLYGAIDENLKALVDDGRYKTPEFDGLPSADVELTGGTYSDIINEEAYTIQQEQYMLMNVKADEWFLFVPPFDISEVYVLETYKEDDLATMAKSTSWQEAIDLQADANMDLFYVLCYTIGYKQSENDFNRVFSEWSRPSGAGGKIKLTHFTGANYSANYYVQRSSRTWGWDSEKSRFVTDWAYLPATMEKVTHGDTEYSVVMKKGEVYSLKFPYKYYGYREEGDGNGNNNWDYWTGKYILFVGKGPQTIEGTNYHQTITNPTMTAPSGSAEIRANSTFASMEVSDMGAYYLGENQRFTPSIDDSEFAPIDATQGFVLLNKSTASPMPQRIASIDMMTGDVTYEPGDGIENTVTGTPTISGEREMLVYTLAGGLGVVPVVSQQVSIYNAAGQLVVSQYLTDEMQFALPAGIYLVRGEKDQVKVMVK